MKIIYIAVKNDKIIYLHFIPVIFGVDSLFLQ